MGVKPAENLISECDILAPCALGAVINDDIIDQLNCAEDLIDNHHERYIYSIRKTAQSRFLRQNKTLKSIRSSNRI